MKSLPSIRLYTWQIKKQSQCSLESSAQTLSVWLEAKWIEIVTGVLNWQQPWLTSPLLEKLPSPCLVRKGSNFYKISEDPTHSQSPRISHHMNLFAPLLSNPASVPFDMRFEGLVCCHLLNCCFNVPDMQHMGQGLWRSVVTIIFPRFCLLKVLDNFLAVQPQAPLTIQSKKILKFQNLSNGE